MDETGTEIKKDKKKKNIVDETEDIENSKTQNFISTIKLTVTKDQHDTNLTCQASHPTYKEPMNAVIRLSVEYKPELKIEHEPEEMKEGDNVKLTCSASANPSKVTFKWYIDDILEYDKVKDDDLEDQKSTLEIAGIGKDMNGKVIKCWASNKIQNKPIESEVLHTLNIQCKIINACKVLNRSISQTSHSLQKSQKMSLEILERKSPWGVKQMEILLLLTPGLKMVI